MTQERINKYLYGYKLHVAYSHGYEYELFETDKKELRNRIKEYTENCPEYPLKVTRGRELNPIWIEQNNNTDNKGA